MKKRGRPNFLVYMGGKLTGRTKEEIVKEHEPIRAEIIQRGGFYLDPFEKEEALFKKKQRCGFEGLRQSIKEVVHLDKEMIKQVDVLLVITGDIPSYGTLLEIGYARYLLAKPVVAIAPKHKSGEMQSWLTSEADYLAQDYKDALDIIVDAWGTPEKRLLWRTDVLANHQRTDAIKRALLEYFKTQNKEV